MADFLSTKRAELDNRLKELRPLHDEYLRLERAVEALSQMERPRRGSGRRRATTAGAGRRRRRGRRGGPRAQEALEVVRKNPGITVSEVGDKLGMRQKNYLYRVMANLQSDGAVRKQGRRFTAT